MDPEYKKLKDCFSYIKSRTDFIPETALILGSGLGAIAERAEVSEIIPFSEIEGFPVTTVEGHAGRFVFGRIAGKNVAIMQGRVHYYEGYSMQDVVLPVRLLKLLGAKKLILTNAVGGINPDLKPGDLMLIKDHISSFVPSPLYGANIEELGVRFPDMSSVYSPELIEKCEQAAAETGTELKKGVYLQTAGPNYETPAEIKMYKMLGADVVGMSTACEATAANHMGMKICGISCITNLAAGISDKPLTHEEVKETGLKSYEKLLKLLTRLLEII